MSTDPRAKYSITELYIVGGRMTDKFTADIAVSTYLELHPEAEEAAVREELKVGLEGLSRAP